MPNGLPFEFVITTVSTTIEQQCEQIPPEPSTGGTQGGILCTGFFDVEKIVQKVEPPGLGGFQDVRNWFLEKKLPFQVLWLRLPDQVVPPPPPPPPPPVCDIFFPRSPGFYGQNFFRPGTLTDAERACAIACVEARSDFLASVLTAEVGGMAGCPTIPVEGCETVILGPTCQARSEAILDPNAVDDLVAAVCGQTPVNQIGQLTRQYFTALLNTCICATGAQGPVGGVGLDYLVDLTQLPEPLRMQAVAFFGTAFPTVAMVLQAAEEILATYCATGMVSANTELIQEILARMNADLATIILPPAA